MIGWNFPSNNNGPITGISDAGIETFKGNLFESLAREICQNSLDAVKDDRLPVRVEFKKFQKDTIKIGGIDELKNAFLKCEDYWSEQKDGKAKDFFRRGVKLIENSKLNILRISDFNTTGLDGADKEINSNWSNLIKGSGVSDKGGSAGGSFGIGKSAAFACSNLRTVFYSTMDKNGITACQGVSRLASFKESNYTTQGIGYYGVKDKNAPLKYMMMLDGSFQREESGTDIFLLGFYSEEKWKEKMICSVLDGFLVAIWKGLLEVKIDDIDISKETLNNVFEKYSDSIQGNIKNYYNTLISVKEPIEWNFNGLGKVIFYLIEKDNYCRKVYISRKSGMKIFEQNRFPRHINFAGVLILDGDEVNRFFRKMESPQHDKWEADRYEENPKLAEKYRRELINKLKEYVNELENYDTSEELDVEGLGDLITDEGTLDGDRNKKEAITDTVTDFNVKKVKFDYRSTGSLGININKGTDDYMEVLGSLDEEGTEIGIENQGAGPNDKTGGGKEGPGVEDEGGNDRVKKAVKLNPIYSRVICSNRNANEYKYIFEIKEDIENIYFTIAMKGEQGADEATVKSAYLWNNKSKKLRVKKNKIYLNNLNTKGKNSILFTINYDDYCSLGVDIYGFEK